MHSVPSGPENNPDQFIEWQQFKSHLIRMWAVLRRQGILKPAITDKNYPRFVEMTDLQRTSVETFVARQIEIYEAAEERQVDFSDTPELLQLALKIMGLAVDPELYKLIKRNDVVELYSIEHLQLFRSFNFFKICNYNLDDILMYEWFNLYERAESDTEQIFSRVVAHLNATECISPFRVPKHLMKERFSETQGLFEIDLKFIASAFKGPSVRDGYVACQSVRVMNPVERNRLIFI